MELYLCLRVYACYLNIPDISFTSASFAWESVSVIYNSIFDIFETMQNDYSSVVIFPDSMAIGRIVHYNFSVSLPGNHGYGLTIVFLLYAQIDVVMYSCFSAYKCIHSPTAVQKHLYRCFRQHFKNLTCIKISDHKISIYRCKYTSILPYAFTQTERFNAKTNCFSEICLSASIFQSQTLIYLCEDMKFECDYQYADEVAEPPRTELAGRVGATAAKPLIRQHP